MDSQNLLQIQEKNLERYRKENPEMLKKDKIMSEEEVFEDIGISNVKQGRVNGYLRLYPEDFIVEEVTADNKIIKIDEFNDNFDLKKDEDEKKKTLYANLIKIGIPTNVALERLSHGLKIGLNKIGFSGLKDADAITAQLIAFPGIKITAKEIGEVSIPNIKLTDFYYNSGTLSPGDLKENMFTITVRTDKDFNKEVFSSNIEMVEKYGVLNYFQSQRFGGVRLLSHKLGRLIMQGEYENAIKVFLFRRTEFEIPLMTNIRIEAEKMAPNWERVKVLYEELPYFFYNEIKVLNYLIKNRDNYIGALIEIKDQTQLWIYAYGSFIFNKYLSELSKDRGCVDEKIPLFLSNNTLEIYRKYLIEDGLLNFRNNLKPFKFIQLRDRLVEGRMFPKNIKYNFFNGGVVINFILPKGAYATTMLSNLFILHSGYPVPDWVGKAEIDPKEIVGNGDIKKIRDVFKDYWYSKIEE